MKISQIIGIGLIVAIIGASAYGLYAFFGLIGVGLLAGFLLPILGILAYVGDFNTGGSNTSPRTYESKGASREE